MKTFTTIVVILLSIIVIIAALSAVYISQDDGDIVCGITIDKPEYKIDDDSDESEPNDDDIVPDGDGNKHTVFIEEGTATWCVNCPNIAEILHELYEVGDYNFYYVSMVYDENNLAEERLGNDYNMYAYPTVFIDGGYKIIVGERSKTEYINAIKEAESREVPEITISVNVTYDNDTDDLETKVFIENNEDYAYDGTLKVYLSEKISRWSNKLPTSDGDFFPYHFGFLDFIMNKPITIEGNSNRSYTDKRGINEFSYSIIKPEDIVVIAVLFNSESVPADSYPDDEDEGDFDAYYVDAAAAAELIEGGNSPPTIGFTSPEIGKINLFSLPLINTIFHNTYLIGRATIEVSAVDDKEVAKVEFYVDDELVYEDNEAPYEYSIRKIDMIKHIFRKRTIKAVAIDDEGRSSSTYFDAFMIFL